MPRLVLDKPRLVEEPTKPRLVLDEPKLSLKTGMEYAKEHPFRTAFQPITKTLGGKTPKEVLMERYASKPGGERYMPAFTRAFTTGVTGDIADILTTPASYIPIPGAKALGKIPIKGTTLGHIAKTIPVRKGFVKGVKELGRYEQALKGLPQKVVASREPLRQAGIMAKEALRDPVLKITQALKEAVPVRATQEALYTAERARRIAKVTGIGKAIPGEKGYQAQLAALKGELPKIQYTGVRNKVTQIDVDDLFKMVEQNPVLNDWDKIPAKKGLAKLLGVEGGAVPTEGELKLLGQIFPEDFVKAVLSKRSLFEKGGQIGGEIINIPRALMSSTDMSAPLRQGAFLIGRPKQWIPAFGNMVRYFFSEKAYAGLMDNIKRRPTYNLMRQAKLELTDISAGLSGREEAFLSSYAEKIPIWGKYIVRASSRAHTGFLNKLRVDVFDDILKSSQKLGVKPEGKFLKDLGNFVSTATGRGDLGRFEKAAVALNAVLFSPRLLASRLSLLNPVYYARLHPVVRKEALKSLFTFAATGFTVLGLAKLRGAEVGDNSRSADFGKIKTGNTRYDIWGGFQQYVRLVEQLRTGEHISSTTGVKTTVGEGYKPLTGPGIVGRFIESKEAPVASFAMALWKGQGRFGKKLDIPKEIGMRFVPMVIQDMYDLYKERGLEGLGMATPAIFGVGVQTYAPTPAEMVYSKNSVLKHAKDLYGQGRQEEALALREKNKDIILMGTLLEPKQNQIKAKEKRIDAIEKNTGFSEEQKKKFITPLNQQIQLLETQMEEMFERLKTSK